MNGKVTHKQNLRYRDVHTVLTEPIVLNAQGWTSAPDRPTDIIPHMAAIQNFGAATGAVTINPSGHYLLGTPNTRITSYLDVRYFYFE